MGRSWALLEHLGSHLEPSSAILSHLGGYLGLSEALLEPSWAFLDALTARGAPRPGPGEGVGGGVNPSPKGKKGVGRGNSLDHLRPKGLVGFPRDFGFGGANLAEFTWDSGLGSASPAQRRRLQLIL